MAATASRGRGGRKPKGKRAQVTLRIPEDQKPVFEAAAREAGMFLGDYVALVLAQHHDLPAPDYLFPRDKGQEALAISA